MKQWFPLLRKDIDKLRPEVQEKIYRSFYQFVYRDIYFIVRVHADVEDIIQEAFIKAITQRSKITHTTNLPAWVRRIARNTTIDWLRKNKQRKQEWVSNHFNIKMDMDKFSTSSVASDFEIKISNEMLYQSIQNLKPEHRILIIMFYFEEKSYKEICKQLKLSEQVVTQRLFRARKTLKKLYQKKMEW